MSIASACALAAADQAQPSPQKSDRGGNDQKAAQPPIQITVTTPKKSPEEQKAEADRAQRQDATNERIAQANISIARLTLGLVILGALNVLAIGFGLIYTSKTASAAGRSAGLQRESNERQKLVTELSHRAYLAVNFDTAVYQDENNVFEGAAELVNKGTTPAREVTFRCAAAIVPFPVPDDFDFKFSDANKGASVSIIGPGIVKNLRRTVEGRVPDAEVEPIKAISAKKCLLMWGIVDYLDVFKEKRFVKFAFVIRWPPWAPGKQPKDRDGNLIPPRPMSHDTAHHNESN